MLTSLLLAVSLQFSSPVNYPVSLAGNFGEPRPHHFHGGIDVKTQQAVGKPIFSIGEGYVSRITIGISGFGNAVYVQHPNGYTSVYCHLKDFVPVLRAAVSRHRKANGQSDIIDEYKKPSPPADIILPPSEYPVSEGQLIAISGNTGSSQAPHLHLELHETKSWDMVDPLDFLPDLIKDTTPPMAHAFKAYPVMGEGVFCESPVQQWFPFNTHHLDRPFTAWGKVGFGIWANDYMEESYNKYGIRKTELMVDDELVFSSDVDKIPMECNRMVNSWGDYPFFRYASVWFMKSFIEPGNTLPVIHANANRGIVDFNEERDYRFVYTLSDKFGNQSQYTFVVRGKKQTIPPKRTQHAPWVLHWDRMNNFQLPGVQLMVRRGLLPDDVEMNPTIVSKSGLSKVYRFTDVSYPLFNWATLSIRLDREVKDTDHLCILCDGDKEVEAEYHDGWVTGKIRDLGLSYEIGYKQK